MISRGSILSGPVALGSDREASEPFINLFVTDRALIWDKVVTIFQVSYACMYLNPAKKYCDVIMGYNLIYNNYLGTSNIDHMTAGLD